MKCRDHFKSDSFVYFFLITLIMKIRTILLFTSNNILGLLVMSKYSFQRPEMEIPLQNSHYNPSRDTLGRYSEYSLHSSYKIRAGDAACKLKIIVKLLYQQIIIDTEI